MRKELFALVVVALIFIAFPAALFGYQALRTNGDGARVITINAFAPDQGGFQPDTIRVNVGERVRLRIASADVVHSLDVPALGIESGDILPGHVQEIEFTPARVGRYPFACTRWCSLDHWRMRGTFEVVDPVNPDAPLAALAEPPLYARLKIDLDAMRHIDNVPARVPSATRGAERRLTLPQEFQNAETLRALSPADAFARLRTDPVYQQYDDAQLWDAVAFAWKSATTDERLARGKQLFTRDCAACHGEAGTGNGPAGKELPGLAAMHPEMKRGPQNFTDASQMMSASDILLQGKIIRGGMGTGMPEFGSLYTEQDLWDVIGYIRSFAFDYR